MDVAFYCSALEIVRVIWGLRGVLENDARDEFFEG
jgi:hypothetical protein